MPLGYAGAMALPRDRPSTLADLYAETDTVRVACNRCGLDERWPLAQELAFHGPRELVWMVVEARADDCPRKGETRPYELCGIHCPSLKEHMDWTPLPKRGLA